MLKKLSLSLCLVVSVAHAQSFTIDKKIEKRDGRPYFKSQEGWIGLPLDFAPVEKLRKDLEKHLGVELQHRGEAHVTVITPPEARVINQYLKMETLEKMVPKEGMMRSKIKIVCIKKVVAELKGKKEESWFIALEAPKLLEYRKQVWRKFVGKGGNTEDFQPKRWAPHITLGFTSRDLHDEDRISKAKAECAFDLKTI